MNPFPSRAKKTYPVCLAHINFNHRHHPSRCNVGTGNQNTRAREWNVYFAPGDMCPWVESVKGSTLHAMGGGVCPDASEGTFFSLGTDPENRLMHGAERPCFVFWVCTTILFWRHATNHTVRCAATHKAALTADPMLSSPHGTRSRPNGPTGATPQDVRGCYLRRKQMQPLACRSSSLMWILRAFLRGWRPPSS